MLDYYKRACSLGGNGYPHPDILFCTSREISACRAQTNSLSSRLNTSTSLHFFLFSIDRRLIHAYRVYPLIDPKPHVSSQTFKDKVVIITGGSTGIGAAAALLYAQAGAKLLLVARTAKNLEERKKIVESAVPGAQVLILAGDIADPEVGKRAVKLAVDTWKQLDIVVANSAGYMGGKESASGVLLALTDCILTRRRVR